MFTKDHIFREIRRTAEANAGMALGWRRFASETGISYYDWCGKFWARWGDAVKEAGIAPNRLSSAYTNDELWSALAKLTRQLGHIPTKAELRLAGRNGDYPSEKVFRRLGGRAECLAGLTQFCANDSAYEEVRAICEASRRESSEAPEVPETEEGPLVGYVYLLRAGRHHKIGHTNSVGRRERELAIQLPQKAVLVHSITTDDPVGIEAYWHRRFDEKRANGEWFLLDPSDIAAFKRRRFM